jgi:hypothetical protein
MRIFDNLFHQFHPCGQGRSCDARKHNEPVRLETLRNPRTWTVGLGREPLRDSSANPSIKRLAGTRDVLNRCRGDDASADPEGLSAFIDGEAGESGRYGKERRNRPT